MGGLYIFLYIANSPSQLNLNIHFRLRKNKCEQDTSLPRKEQNQARSTSPFIDGSPHPAHWLSEESAVALETARRAGIKGLGWPCSPG
jgi:hypothetical protein